MLFNPIDKSNSIIADIDFLLFGTGATFNSDYSIDDRTRNINISLDEVVSELFKADPNWEWDDNTNADFPIATMDLAASQDHYVIHDSTLVINRVRVKDSNGKWKTLEPMQRREFDDGELESTGTPDGYYKKGNAVFPVPVPNYGASGGVEIEFQRGANHFSKTDTNAEPGFNSQYHQFLSVGAALRYALGNGMREKASFLSSEKERIRQDIRNHFLTRNQEEQPRIKLSRPSVRRYGLS